MVSVKNKLRQLYRFQCIEVSGFMQKDLVLTKATVYWTFNADGIYGKRGDYSREAHFIIQSNKLLWPEQWGLMALHSATLAALSPSKWLAVTTTVRSSFRFVRLLVVASSAALNTAEQERALFCY